MSNEVVKQEDMAKDLMSMGFDGVKDGFSGKVDASTSTIPFVKLMQAISPEVKKKGAEYVEGAEAGMFLNSVAKTLYGDVVRAIPILFEPMYVEWKPNRGGFVARHTIADARKLTVTEEFGKWQTEEGNLLIETYMYYFLLPDHLEDGLVAVAMASSNIKPAKMLNTLVTRKFFPNTAKVAPSFVQVYNMQSVEVSNDKGAWYQPKFSFDSFVTPDVAQMAVAMLESLRAGDIKADMSQMDGSGEVYDGSEEDSAF